MKLFYTLLTSLLLMIALPIVAAQRPCLEGRVQTAGKQQVTLSVYITVTSPEAPGKVPDKFAAQAIRLEDQAQRLDLQGKSALAEQVRAKVRQLRCQREVTIVIREHDLIPLFGMSTATLATAAIGVHLTMEVAAPASMQLPTRVTLLKTARQVNMRNPTAFHPLPHTANDAQNYFQLSGIVLNKDPLTVGINGQALVIDDPYGLGYRRQTPLYVHELRAAQPVLVWATVGANGQVQQARKIVVFTNATDIPYDQIGDLGE